MLDYSSSPWCVEVTRHDSESPYGRAGHQKVSADRAEQAGAAVWGGGAGSAVVPLASSLGLGYLRVDFKSSSGFLLRQSTALALEDRYE